MSGRCSDLDSILLILTVGLLAPGRVCVCVCLVGVVIFILYYLNLTVGLLAPGRVCVCVFGRCSYLDSILSDSDGRTPSPR